MSQVSYTDEGRRDSIRVRRPSQRVVTIDEPPIADNIIVVRRPSMDRRMVRIDDTPTIHAIRRPVSEICLVPQELPQSPIIFQTAPPVMYNPPQMTQMVAQPPPQPCLPPPPPQPTNVFPGGELRITIGNARPTNQPNHFVYNMNDAQSMSCQITNNQPNEYVLTSVEGNGTTLGRGFVGRSKGFDSYEQDNGSYVSDGHHSAVIDLGRGGNSFYPSLPTYNE